MIPITIDQFPPLITWIISLFELIMGLYLLVSGFRIAESRLAAVYTILISINAFFIGCSFYILDESLVLPVTAVVAGTSPVAISLLLPLSLMFFHSSWRFTLATQADGKSKWLKRLLVIGSFILSAIILLPALLVTVDILFGTRFYFSGINAYQAGSIFERQYIAGNLASYVHYLVYGLALALTLILLLVLAIGGKFFSKPIFRRYALILFGTTLISGGVEVAALYFPVSTLVLVLARFILALSYARVCYLLTRTESAYPRRNFQYRQTALLLITIVPIVLAVISYITFRFGALTEENLLHNFETSGNLLTIRSNDWLQGSVLALKGLADQPAVQQMEVTGQITAVKNISTSNSSLELVAIINSDGMSLVRSDGLNSQDFSNKAWFLAAKSGQSLVLDTQSTSEISRMPVIIAALPIRSSMGQFEGVVMLSANKEKLAQKILSIDLGLQGFAMIVDQNDRMVIYSGAKEPVRAAIESNGYPSVAGLRQGQEGLGRFVDFDGKAWRTYLTTLDNGWGLVVQQPESELFLPVRAMKQLAWGAILASLVAMTILIVILVRNALSPLDPVMQAIEAVSKADFSQKVAIHPGNQLGNLAEAVNQMIAQVHAIITGLESRLSSDDQELQRRTMHLQLTAQVVRRATAVRDVGQLLNDLVLLITEQLNFYHLGIFILDDTGQYAILQATNSEGGLRMLSRGYKMEVGQKGIVGYVAATGRARIALEVGTDAAFLPNPDLPRTRSEMALPIKVSGRIIGVIDVQSTQSSAFNKDDVELFQLLADQIALAIDSARSLQDSQQALLELSALYGKQTLRDWQRRLSQRSLAYRYNRLVVEPINENTIFGRSPNTLPGHQLEVPISLHGQNFGALTLRREPDQPKWTDEDLALVVDAVAQLAPTLEYARLLEEVEQRAQLESMVSQISTYIQGSLDLETVLRNSVEEIAKAVNATRIRFRLVDTENKHIYSDGEENA